MSKPFLFGNPTCSSFGLGRFDSVDLSGDDERFFPRSGIGLEKLRLVRCEVKGRIRELDSPVGGVVRDCACFDASALPGVGVGDENHGGVFELFDEFTAAVRDEPSYR